MNEKIKIDDSFTYNVIEDEETKVIKIEDEEPPVQNNQVIVLDDDDPVNTVKTENIDDDCVEIKPELHSFTSSDNTTRPSVVHTIQQSVITNLVTDSVKDEPVTDDVKTEQISTPNEEATSVVKEEEPIIINEALELNIKREIVDLIDLTKNDAEKENSDNGTVQSAILKNVIDIILGRASSPIYTTEGTVLKEAASTSSGSQKPVSDRNQASSVPDPNTRRSSASNEQKTDNQKLRVKGVSQINTDALKANATNTDSSLTGRNTLEEVVKQEEDPLPSENLTSPGLLHPIPTLINRTAILRVPTVTNTALPTTSSVVNTTSVSPFQSNIQGVTAPYVEQNVAPNGTNPKVNNQKRKKTILITLPPTSQGNNVDASLKNLMQKPNNVGRNLQQNSSAAQNHLETPQLFSRVAHQVASQILGASTQNQIKTFQNSSAPENYFEAPQPFSRVTHPVASQIPGGSTQNPINIFQNLSASLNYLETLQPFPNQVPSQIPASSTQKKKNVNVKKGGKKTQPEAPGTGIGVLRTLKPAELLKLTTKLGELLEKEVPEQTAPKQKMTNKQNETQIQEMTNRTEATTSQVKTPNVPTKTQGISRTEATTSQVKTPNTPSYTKPKVNLSGKTLYMRKKSFPVLKTMEKKSNKPQPLNESTMIEEVRAFTSNRQAYLNDANRRKQLHKNMLRFASLDFGNTQDVPQTDSPIMETPKSKARIRKNSRGDVKLVDGTNQVKEKPKPETNGLEAFQKYLQDHYVKDFFPNPNTANSSGESSSSDEELRNNSVLDSSTKSRKQSIDSGISNSTKSGSPKDPRLTNGVTQKYTAANKNSENRVANGDSTQKLTKKQKSCDFYVRTGGKVANSKKQMNRTQNATENRKRSVGATNEKSECSPGKKPHVVHKNTVSNPVLNEVLNTDQRNFFDRVQQMCTTYRGPDSLPTSCNSSQCSESQMPQKQNVSKPAKRPKSSPITDLPREKLNETYNTVNQFVEGMLNPDTPSSSLPVILGKKFATDYADFLKNRFN